MSSKQLVVLSLGVFATCGLASAGCGGGDLPLVTFYPGASSDSQYFVTRFGVGIRQ